MRGAKSDLSKNFFKGIVHRQTGPVFRTLLLFQNSLPDTAWVRRLCGIFLQKGLQNLQKLL